MPCSSLVKRVLSLSDLFVNVVDCVGHHVRSGNKSKRLINTFCLWKKKKLLRDEEVGKSGTGSTKGRAAGGAGSGRRAAGSAHAAPPERRRRPPARPGRGAARSRVRRRGRDGRRGGGKGRAAPPPASRRKTSSGSPPRSRSLPLCFPSSLSLPLESHQACNQQQKLT